MTSTRLLSTGLLTAASLVAALCLGAGGCADPGEGPDTADAGPSYRPVERRYYVAAEPVTWDYAPLGHDPIYDRALPAPWGDQLVYAKLRYRAYTDDSFTTPLPEDETRGILGPELRGVVGDTLVVTFLNRTERPLTMHPHGVSYDADNEGAAHGEHAHGGNRVLPGERFRYTWHVRQGAGPAPGEPSSRVWLYHSHVDAEDEIYRGLVGTIVITDPAHARADGRPDDVDRELTALFLVFDENQAGEGGESAEPSPEEAEGHLKHAINGRIFGNLTGIVVRRGERVRWYLAALGTEVDLHTVHWHGATVLSEGRRTDVVELLPASMKVADMRPEEPGPWMMHCHVGDHIAAGMYTSYLVED